MKFVPLKAVELSVTERRSDTLPFHHDILIVAVSVCDDDDDEKDDTSKISSEDEIHESTCLSLEWLNDALAVGGEGFVNSSLFFFTAIGIHGC